MPWVNLAEDLAEEFSDIRTPLDEILNKGFTFVTESRKEKIRQAQRTYYEKNKARLDKARAARYRPKVDKTPPKRDRAEYMRHYRARKKKES